MRPLISGVGWREFYVEFSKVGLILKFRSSRLELSEAFEYLERVNVFCAPLGDDKIHDMLLCKIPFCSLGDPVEPS